MTLANTDFATLDSLEQEILDKLVPHVDVPAVSGASALSSRPAGFWPDCSRVAVDRSTLE